MFILSDVVVTSFSCRSKIAGYAAKEFVLCCLLHTSVNLEAGDGGRGLLGRLANSSKVRSLMGSWGGGGLVCGNSGIGTWSDPTCSHLITSSSSGAEAGMGSCCVGASSDLDATRPCRLSMSFRSSSARRIARASRFTPGVDIVGAGPSMLALGSFVTRGLVLHRLGDWMTVHRPEVSLTV